ncbi:LysE family translocator, partial [Pseudoalteromonas sp. BZP1]
WSEVMEITAAFLAVAFPCVGVWLVAGAGLRQLLTNHTAQRIFNVSMALLLVFSVLPVVFDIWTFYTD